MSVKINQTFNKNTGSNMGCIGMPENAAAKISLEEASHIISNLHIALNAIFCYLVFKTKSRTLVIKISCTSSSRSLV
jgi:hypothetical protein